MNVSVFGFVEKNRDGYPLESFGEGQKFSSSLIGLAKLTNFFGIRILRGSSSEYTTLLMTLLLLRLLLLTTTLTAAFSSFLGDISTSACLGDNSFSCEAKCRFRLSSWWKAVGEKEPCSSCQRGHFKSKGFILALS